MDHDGDRTPDTERDPFIRVPGLLRRWEIELFVTPGIDLRIEEAGTACDGTQLFAVYRRERNTNSDKEQ